MSATSGAAASALPQRPRSAVRRIAGAAAAHGVLLGGAAVAWIHALRNADLHRISGYGLLPALPASYYVALALLGTGFLLAVATDSSPLLFALYVLAAILVIHATAPLLYTEPRYAWTYKHLGVTDYIAHYGRTDRSIDIYQNWPGFFALTALLQRASGVSMSTVASWAEVGFNVAYVAAIMFVLRGVTREKRVLWSAAWLFVLANWIGQDYFAPQSFAYVLYLVLIGLCIRCAPPGKGTWWGRLDRLAAGRLSPWVEDQEHAPLRPLPALIAGALLFVAITTSHQLSPLLCIVAIAAFAATTRRLPGWLLLAMLALEAAWLGAAWQFLSAKYSLFSFSPFERPVATGANAAWALPGTGLSTLASRMSVATLVALALAGLWRRWRTGYFDLPLIAMIAAPALVIAVQPYNGEGLFRVYLYALPWLCFIAASAIMPAAGGGRALARWLALAGASAVLGVVLLFAFFGREIINYVAPQDVAVELWYERHAPAGSAVIYLAPNVPNRITYRYARMQVWAGSFSPSLTEEPYFRNHVLGLADLPALEAKLRDLQATQAYVMIDRSAVNYVHASGVMPPGSISRLELALRSSPDFQLVFQDRDAMLFRLVGSGASS